MSIVIIAEKPSVASDIAQVLGIDKKTEHFFDGDTIKVTWAVGHLLTLQMLDDYDSKFKNWHSSLEDLPYVPEKFQIQPVKRTKKQLDAILKLLKSNSVEEIVNACDAAREGELIFRRIVEYANSSSTITRMWMQSMTPKAIATAYEQRKGGDDYAALSDAAHARSEADWIIGMNGTRVANRYLPKKRGQRTATSLGRVQTATLAMIVDHEIEVLSHIPEPFWQLHATFDHEGGTWIGKWSRNGESKENQKPDRIYDAEEKERIEKILSEKNDVSVSEQSRTKNERPPLNLDLTNLQKKANSLWSWSSSRTLKVAQDLYDTFKLITYPRTDSQYLPDDMNDVVMETITSLSKQKDYTSFSQHLVKNGLHNTQRNFNTNKVSDHYAIIPTGEKPKGTLSKDHVRLYDFIVRNFLASWYEQSVWAVTKRTGSVGGELFSKEIEELSSPGWREVIPKNNSVPEGWFRLTTNPEHAALSSFEFSEELTKPKGRLKEGGLLKLMENAGKILDDDEHIEAMKDKGLGTPATRADTIEKLIEKSYIRRSKSGSISATAHGIQIVDILRRIPVEWITSPELTGEMEASLLAVQKGQLAKSEYMKRVVELTHELVEKIREHDRIVLFEGEQPIGSCLLCEHKVMETTLSYQCEKNTGKGKGCEFVMWKDSSGRWYDRTTATRLLENKEIENLHGFFNYSGEHYEQSIRLQDNGRVVSQQSEQEEVSEEHAEISSCIFCDKGTIRLTTNSYQCDNTECKFKGMKTVMCHREISVDEAKKLFSDGKSDLFDEFISKKNRPFSAYLVKKGNGIRYEFPLRTKTDHLPKFEIKPGVVAVCPRHKCDIIETATHFQVKDEASGCKIQIARQVSGREITRDEAKTLIENNELGPFDNFISKKTSNPFSSLLYLKKNEAIGYRFAKQS